VAKRICHLLDSGGHLTLDKTGFVDKMRDIIAEFIVSAVEEMGTLNT